MMCSSINRQKGAVLLISIVMLLLITTLALSSMKSSIIQEQMAANQYDYHLAFQAAEAALRYGERLRRDEPGFVPLSFGPTPPPDHWRSIWLEKATIVEMPDDLGLAKSPEVITEELDFDSTNKPSRIRVTARGFGARQDTEVVLQSVIAL